MVQNEQNRTKHIKIVRFHANCGIFRELKRSSAFAVDLCLDRKFYSDFIKKHINSQRFGANSVQRVVSPSFYVEIDPGANISHDFARFPCQRQLGPCMV